MHPSIHTITSHLINMQIGIRLMIKKSFLVFFCLLLSPCQDVIKDNDRFFVSSEGTIHEQFQCPVLLLRNLEGSLRRFFHSKAILLELISDNKDNDDQ